MFLYSVLKQLNSRQTTAFFCIVLAILILENSIVHGRSVKRSRQRKSDSEENDSPGNSALNERNSDLIALVEDDLQLDAYSNMGNYNENTEGVGVKRKARSPLDEDIDEDADDSDEDDEEEEGKEKNGDKKGTDKSDKDTPSASTTLPPGTSQISKPNSAVVPLTPTLTTNAMSFNSTGGGSLIPHTSVRSVALNFGGQLPPTGNKTGPALLPPGFKAPPIGIPIGKKPPFSGIGIPHPPHGRPHAPGFPGKFPPLPPHLLNQLSAPKSPAKKGELNLPSDYNNLVIPKLNLGKLIGIESYSAVPVLVFLNIRSVRDIDETMETITLDLDLVIEWVDGFLFDPISAATTRQPDIILNPIFLKKIWRPDIYIDEIVKVKRASLMNKPLKLKFNPSNGFISYTTRLIVHLSCDMIYNYYPADTHRCEFTFRSYSYFGKDMQLSWLGTGVYLQDPYDPNFDLQVESIDRVKLRQTFRKLTNDTYDGLRFTLLARRKLSFHLFQTYLPSVFFIVITWLCFLVPARMVEARIGISMTTLLTLTSMFSSVRESTPIVSYVKAIDIWMVFCIFFVFLTLLEFATLVWFRSRREDAEEQKLEHQRMLQERTGKDRKDTEATFTRSPSLASVKLRRYEWFAEFTEKYAFIIFSIVFTVFNVIYWSWLLVSSDYFDWRVNATLNADVDLE